MADELKIKVKIEPDIDAAAKERFEKALQTIAGKYKAKPLRIPVELDTKQIQTQLDKFLKKSVKVHALSSVDSSPSNNSYAQQSKDADAFYKKNLSWTDAISKQEAIGRARFAAQLKEQMTQDKARAAAEVANDKRVAAARDAHNRSSAKYKKFGFNNTALHKDAGLSSEYSVLGDRYKSLIGSNDIEAMKSLNSEFNDFTRQVTEAGLLGQTFTSKLSAQMSKLGVYFSAAALMMGAWKQLKNMINTVIQLDGVVTDLQIATGATRAETKELLNTYSEMGQTLGASTIDVAKSADTWLRQGYSVAQTNTLIKNSMMLSKLGQMESADATTALTSAMKGYNIAVEDSSTIVDKFTSIDMEAAVSAGYIATAMAETATSARLAGVDVNKLTGYIAAIGEVTQDGAESVGNFMKTLFARMGNVKAGNLIDPESAESLSDVETTLSGLGIKLRNSKGEFNNFGSTLDTVAANWSNYGTVQQRAIAVAFSGTRQQEKFLTLMEHYGEATEYSAIATESAGTALDKYENSYLKSVAASQEKFTASFEQVSSSIWNSELISGTFNMGSGMLGFLSKLMEMVGALPPLISIAGGAYSAFTNKGFYKSGGLNEKNFTSIFKEDKIVKNDIKAFAQIDKLIADGVPRSQALTAEWSNLSLSSQSLGENIEKTNQSFVQGSASLGKLTLSAKLASAGMQALSLAGNMLISFGIGYIISGVVTGISALVNMQQEAINKANKFTESWAEQEDVISSVGNTIKEVSSDYQTLAKGIGTHGENISLSADEYSRYNDIANQIADMFPTMVSGFSDEGNAIIKNKGSIEALTQAYKDLKQSKYDEISVQSNDVYEGFQNEYQSGSFTKDYSKIDLMETGKRIESELSSLADIPNPEKQLAAYLDLLVAWEKTPGVTRKVFDNIGVNSKSASFVLENLSQVMGKVSAQNRILTSEYEAGANKLRPIYDAFLNTDFKALQLPASDKNSIIDLLNSFDSKFFTEFKTANEMNQWILDTFVIPLSDPNTKAQMQKAIAGLLNPDLKTLPASEYEQVVNSLIDSLPKEAQDKIRLYLQFEFITEDMQKKIEEFEKKTGIKDIAKRFSFEDIKIILNPNFQFTGHTVEALAAKIQEFKDSIQNSPVEINVDTKSTINNLKKVEDNFKILRDALQEVSDDNGLSPNTLSTISDSFGQLDGFDSLVASLSKSKPVLSEVKTALEQLGGSYLASSEVAKQLSEGQSELVISGLKSIGVTNAEAVVTGILTANAEKLAASKLLASTPELANATAQEIALFATEQGLSATTTQEICKLRIEKQLASTTDFLDKSSKEVQVLLDMAIAAGATTASLAELNKVKHLKAAQESGQLSSSEYDEANAYIEKFSGGSIDLKFTAPTFTTPSYKAPTSKKEKNSGDAYKEAAEAEFKYAKYLLDKKEISEHEYYKRVEGINDRYYKGKTKYLDDYRQHEIEVLNGLEQLRVQHFNKYFELCGKLYETHQDEKKYINDLTWASNNLVKTDEERLKIAEALAKAHEDMASNQIGDLEHKNYLLSQANGGVGTENAQIANLRAAQNIAASEANRLRAAGFGEDSSQIQAQQKKWWELENTIQDLIKKMTDPIDAALEDALNKEIDSANELLDITKKLIEQEKKDQIKALEDQKTERQEIVDLQKESLRLTEDARKYDLDVKDKTDGLSKLQSQADALALDDSREAKIKREELLNQIAEKQKELNEFQRENSIKNTEDALDKEQKEFEKTKDEEIKDIEEWLDDVSNINAAASDRIKYNSDKLYDELLNWNKKYGTGIDNDITKMWNLATDAIKGYSSILDAIAEKQANLDTITTDKENTGNALAGMTSSDLKDREEMIKNSQAWEASDAKTRKALNERNMVLGSRIGATYNASEGRWYRNGVPLYHTGGVVGGGAPTVNSDELLLLAKKGEVIFNETQQNSLRGLIQKLSINAIIPPYNNLNYNTVAAMSSRTPSSITVHSPITISGNAPKEVLQMLKNHGRDIANIVCNATNN